MFIGIGHLHLKVKLHLYSLIAKWRIMTKDVYRKAVQFGLLLNQPEFQVVTNKINTESFCTFLISSKSFKNMQGSFIDQNRENLKRRFILKVYWISIIKLSPISKGLVRGAEACLSFCYFNFTKQKSLCLLLALPSWRQQ